MYTKVNSMAIQGIDGQVISVETDVSAGLPEFSMVGYLSSEVREARERVRISLKNSGFSLAPRRITVNLSPADLRKEGTSFDLAVALGILASYGCLPDAELTNLAAIGELGLDGSVHSVPGVLSMVAAAREAGISACIVPKANEAEGALVEEIRVIGVDSLPEAVHLLSTSGGWRNIAQTLGNVLEDKPQYEVDFCEVNGQAALKRAAEVAAAGMHNLLMIGPPGSGKTMIAKRIPTILPELTRSESLEVSKIYSVCGLLSPVSPLKRERPFRAPHHTVSYRALVGGGRVPRPGEISLANRGVLFLDELPEFSKISLEVLRQPLEERTVQISRVYGSYQFPADCMVVAAMNPCRCGYYPDRNRCQCSDADVKRYLQRVSRPLLDRMDLCVEAPAIGYEAVRGKGENENSDQIRKRVKSAWERQTIRFKGLGISCNAQMTGKQVKKFCLLGEQEEAMMERIFDTLGLSARAYHRILKVARTIADLDGEDEIKEQHLGEAIGYRGLEQRFWG
ncbi:YifB family Mg chelatase-like AAA ATPase [Hominifimenecus sp. rT4P-3]|uniref:YifB family Mg chelatase-like AAA ATPase n=1 Tax=Hominifimenecus sp. rT4P-3 TaxID=3242979 RepID=UPI003DA6025C